MTGPQEDTGSVAAMMTRTYLQACRRGSCGVATVVVVDKLGHMLDMLEGLPRSILWPKPLPIDIVQQFSSYNLRIQHFLHLPFLFPFNLHRRRCLLNSTLERIGRLWVQEGNMKYRVYLHLRWQL